MLERLFTSRTRQSILSYLLLNPKQEFHLRELARNCQANPSLVLRELGNLAQLGIVFKRKQAHLSLYSLNPSSPILGELSAIFLKTDHLGETIRKKLANQASFVLVFGSFAAGKQESASDIDLLIISKKTDEEIIPIISPLEKKLNREINYILWDEKTLREKASTGNALLQTIKEAPLIFIIGEESEFRQIISPTLGKNQRK